MSHIRFENSPPQLRELLQYLVLYSRFISCDSMPEYWLHWLHPTTVTINNDYIISFDSYGPCRYTAVTFLSVLETWTEHLYFISRILQILQECQSSHISMLEFHGLPPEGRRHHYSEFSLTDAQTIYRVFHDFRA